MDFIGVGFSEVIIILVIALLAVGPRRLPEIAFKLGQIMGKFKLTTSELTRNITDEINRETADLRSDGKRLKQDITEIAREPVDSEEENET